LPLATEEEISKQFARSKVSWNQGASPSYVKPPDLENQLAQTLTTVDGTIKKKTQVITGYKNGIIGYVAGGKKPHTGSSWNYELVSGEKKLLLNLFLRARRHEALIAHNDQSHLSFFGCNRVQPGNHAMETMDVVDGFTRNSGTR
jgi:hypothetical protein